MGLGLSKDQAQCAVYQVKNKKNKRISYLLGLKFSSEAKDFTLGAKLGMLLSDLMPRVSKVLFESMDFITDSQGSFEAQIYQLCQASSIDVISVHKSRVSRREHEQGLVASGIFSFVALLGIGMEVPFQLEYMLIFVMMLTVSFAVNSGNQLVSRGEDLLDEVEALGRDDSGYFDVAAFHYERRQEVAESLISEVKPALLVCSNGNLGPLVDLLKKECDVTCLF